MSAFLPVKVLNWPTVHINYFVLGLCRKTINSLLVVSQCLISDHIHDYFIKHQTTWHETSSTIITDILFFQWIKNWVTFQYNIFDGDKNSFPNGGNIIFWFFLLDWRQPCNLYKRSLMDIQYDLNSYPLSNGFFNCTWSMIKWEDWIEESSYSLK